MAELFRDDLNSHNAHRATLRLEPLGIASHIVPVDEAAIRDRWTNAFEIEVHDYLNTYMLVTHLLYPHLSAELKHNQPVHDFAATLPEIGPGYSPYKILVLKKRHASGLP
jgi:hypothetical protein